MESQDLKCVVNQQYLYEAKLYGVDGKQVTVQCVGATFESRNESSAASIDVGLEVNQIKINKDITVYFLKN